jgi:MarR family 2-MHQ and catechol resistance regulon transcriptional repressor
MPTHYSGKKADVRALDAFIKLVRASESLTARLSANVQKRTGLTITQFGVLESLFHLGPMCQKDLAEKQLKSGGNITLVVDNLEKQALVKRERSQEDRRMVVVHATQKGEKLMRGYFPEHARAIHYEMSALSAGDQETLGRLCRKLGLQEGRVAGDYR